jgi:prolyl-tRNA synthetase
MKDMYGFFETQEDFDRFYDIVKASYIKAFKRCGLDAKVTEASGGSFSEKLSYEFMVLSDAGEDDILYCDSCSYCVNIEVAKSAEGDACPTCGKGKLIKARAVEAGNIFDLGLKYPKAFGFTYKDKEGKEQVPVMGCYGFGTTRLVGTIVETFADEKGMVWPESVAPFRIHLVSLGQAGDEVTAAADGLYDELRQMGSDVLYDDRDARAGEKFADSDLIGIPWRVVVGKQGLADGTFEVVNRATGEVKKCSKQEVLAL